MPEWHRTLYTIWFTQFIALLGFYFVVPFIPCYVQQLGISDPREVVLWAGIATSANPIAMAVMSPVWGVLSDRYGYKIMVVRASFAGAIILALMGLVTNVQQLIVLRLAQGAFSGTIAATTTLVASTTPKEHSGMALGSLQTAVFLGTSLGPLLGGLVGDNLGYRPSFWITGALLLLSGLLVVFLVPKDPSPTDATARTRRARSWADLKVLLGSGAALLPLLIARTLYRAAMQVPNPALPLFVQANMPPGTHVATVTGLITGAFAVGSAAGSPLAGNWGDRLGYRRLLLFAGLAAGLFYLPQAFVRLPGWLLVWQLLAGLAIGGALAVLVAMLAHATPKGYEGAVFGLDASAMGVANAIGPMLGASAAAAFGLQIPFALAAATCVISTLLLMVQVGAADLLAPVLKRRAP